MSDLNVNNSSSQLNEYTLSPQEEIRIHKEEEEDLSKKIATDLDPHEKVVMFTTIFKDTPSETAANYQKLTKMFSSPADKDIIDKAYTEVTGLTPPQINDSLTAAPVTRTEGENKLEKNPFGLK